MGDLSPGGDLSTATAVEAFCRSCLAKGLRPKTVAWYRSILALLVRRHELLPTSPEPLEELLAGLGAVADTTRYDYWVALRVFYRWAHGRLAAPQAMELVERPRVRPTVPGSLAAAQLSGVLAAARNRRDRALLTLLLDTGIRLGEACSLTWRRVQEDRIIVDGKVGRREVPISPWARRQLVGVDLPWRGKRGPLTVGGVQLAVRRCLRRAGVADGGPHLLRHTFARLYLRAGGDVFSLQRILGHRDLATTRIYADLELGEVLVRHAEFSPIARLRREATGAG